MPRIVVTRARAGIAGAARATFSGEVAGIPGTTDGKRQHFLTCVDSSNERDLALGAPYNCGDPVICYLCYKPTERAIFCHYSRSVIQMTVFSSIPASPNLNLTARIATFDSNFDGGDGDDKLDRSTDNRRRFDRGCLSIDRPSSVCLSFLPSMS